MTLAQPQQQLLSAALATVTAAAATATARGTAAGVGGGGEAGPSQTHSPLQIAAGEGIKNQAPKPAPYLKKAFRDSLQGQIQPNTLGVHFA